MATVDQVPNGTVPVQRFIEQVWNGTALDELGELVTADFVVHHLGSGTDRNQDEFAAFHGGLLEAIPDLDFRVEDLIVDGDTVVAHVWIRGTPERQYGALAPTGQSFDAVGFQKYRLEDDRIAEVWVLPNAMGMLRDLGIFPDSPGEMLRLVFAAMKGRLLGG